MFWSFSFRAPKLQLTCWWTGESCLDSSHIRYNICYCLCQFPGLEIGSRSLGFYGFDAKPTDWAVTSLCMQYWNLTRVLREIVGREHYFGKRGGVGKGKKSLMYTEFYHTNVQIPWSSCLSNLIRLCLPLLCHICPCLKRLASASSRV